LRTFNIRPGRDSPSSSWRAASSSDRESDWAPIRTIDEAIEDVIAYEQGSLSTHQTGLGLAG
jgi:hypothetical protein